MALDFELSDEQKLIQMTTREMLNAARRPPKG